MKPSPLTSFVLPEGACDTASQGRQGPLGRLPSVRCFEQLSPMSMICDKGRRPALLCVSPERCSPLSPAPLCGALGFPAGRSVLCVMVLVGAHMALNVCVFSGWCGLPPWRASLLTESWSIRCARKATLGLQHQQGELALSAQATGSGFPWVLLDSPEAQLLPPFCQEKENGTSISGASAGEAVEPGSLGSRTQLC